MSAITSKNKYKFACNGLYTSECNNIDGSDVKQRHIIVT